MSVNDDALVNFESFTIKINQLVAQLDDRQKSNVISILRISKPTLQRWLEGASAPHPLGREPVISTLEKILDTEKTKISKDQYYQLVGVLKLAEKYNGLLKDLVSTAAMIVGECGDDGYYGHVSDAIYSGNDECNAEDLLSKLAIVVDWDNQ